MNYLSTRGDRNPRGFSDILLEGLAPDGGLYLPEAYPQVDAATLARWRHNITMAAVAVYEEGDGAGGRPPASKMMGLACAVPPV